ncbi:MAG: Sec23/Sec24 zinc finger-containing protein [Methanobacteriota archaeon]|nr:MAG: Sec23/Sec24 zinc finger-containing protein [Euryarchaeota archaeon]
MARDSAIVARFNAWSDFIAEGNGNVNPRFMRCSLGHVPTTSAIMSESQLPFLLSVTPLARVQSQLGEAPLQVVDFGESGPLRCNRCRGYINLFVKWEEGGRVWRCNLCGGPNDVPPTYQCSLDQWGMRHDRPARAELCQSSVEFVAPPVFCTRALMPLSVFFVVEATHPAIASGAFAAALEAIKTALDVLEQCADGNAQAGLMVFDSRMHFFDLTPSRSEVRHVLMGDVDDAFAPLPPSQATPCVAAARPLWDALLLRLPEMFPLNSSRSVQGCGGAAMKAGIDTLSYAGGRMIAFLHTLPQLGEGKLSVRENMSQYGTPKERDMYLPSPGAPASAFYADMGKAAAAGAVCMHLNVLSSQYIDIGSMAPAVALSGGDVHLYPHFTPPHLAAAGGTTTGGAGSMPPPARLGMPTPAPAPAVTTAPAVPPADVQMQISSEVRAAAPSFLARVSERARARARARVAKFFMRRLLCACIHSPALPFPSLRNVRHAAV